MANRLNELEALLFVAGDLGMSQAELKKLLALSQNQLFNLIDQFKNKLEATDSALKLLQYADRLKLVTRAEYSELLQEYSQSTYQHRLSQAALEILAIIAYKQPVTRLDIEEIRGVASSGPIQKLISYDLIEEQGRLDLPGRPILYGTTEHFLEAFDLEDLSDLEKIELDLDQAKLVFDDGSVSKDSTEEEEENG